MKKFVAVWKDETKEEYIFKQFNSLEELKEDIINSEYIELPSNILEFDKNCSYVGFQHTVEINFK